MNDQLFDTEAKRNAAIAAFSTLIQSEGWKLLERIWDANIEFLREQLENGTGKEETKADVDRIRDKLALLKEIRNTPTKWIKELAPQEQPQVTIDPYPTVDDLRPVDFNK